MNNEQLATIKRYAILDGTEYGQAVLAVLALYEFRVYFEDSFNNVLAAKLLELLEYFQDNYIIVSEEYDYTQVVESLEFVGS